MAGLLLLNRPYQCGNLLQKLNCYWNNGEEIASGYISACFVSRGYKIFVPWSYKIFRKIFLMYNVEAHIRAKTMSLPVPGLGRREVSFGAPADVLKVKFPVVICPVLTVYFLTYMLLCVPSSVLFQKSCYFVSLCRRSYRVIEA